MKPKQIWATRRIDIIDSRYVHRVYFLQEFHHGTLSLDPNDSMPACGHLDDCQHDGYPFAHFTQQSGGGFLCGEFTRQGGTGWTL